MSAKEKRNYTIPKIWIYRIQLEQQIAIGSTVAIPAPTIEDWTVGSTETIDVDL